MKMACRVGVAKWCGVVAVGAFGGIMSFLAATAPVCAGEMRWPVGLSYVSGFTKITDQIERHLGGTSVSGLPVGLNVQPFYEFDIGVRIGAGLGPLMLVLGDAFFIDVPLSVHAGYALRLSDSAALYARGGFAYNLAIGDYTEGSSPGYFAAGGVELMRNRRIHLAIEAGFNSAEIELESSSFSTTKIRPVGFTVGLFAIF